MLKSGECTQTVSLMGVNGTRALEDPPNLIATDEKGSFKVLWTPSWYNWRVPREISTRYGRTRSHDTMQLTSLNRQVWQVEDDAWYINWWRAN